MHQSYQTIVFLFCSIFAISANAGFAGSDFDTLLQRGFHVELPRPGHESTTQSNPDSVMRPIERPLNKDQKASSSTADKDLILQPVENTILDDKYKPWGAASLPKPGNQVILDKIDDELFTSDSEVHTYDQRIHQDARLAML